MTNFMTITNFFNANGIDYEINRDNNFAMVSVDGHTELTFLFRDGEVIDWNDLTQGEFETYFDWDFAEWLDNLDEWEEC